MNRLLLLLLPLSAALAVPLMTTVVLFVEALTSSQGYGVIEAATSACRQMWNLTLSDGAIYHRRYETFLMASAFAFLLGCAVSLFLFIVGNRRRNQHEGG